MGTRDFDNPDAMSSTAYANRLLLLALVNALEERGVKGLSKALAMQVSESIGKEPNSRVDAIFELTNDLENIAETVIRRQMARPKS